MMLQYSFFMLGHCCLNFMTLLLSFNGIVALQSYSTSNLCCSILLSVVVALYLQK